MALPRLRVRTGGAVATPLRLNPVADFERAFASYVGAKHSVAMANGTCTLHVALLALGVKPGDRVAVPPLTMASTTIAVLHAGAVPVFVDVEPDTWLMWRDAWRVDHAIPVDLYGLTPVTDRDTSPVLLGPGWRPSKNNDVYAATMLTGDDPPSLVVDSAQTLRAHERRTPFTSYSFQTSKILALGEGGMLVTDSDDLAALARSYASLGYDVGSGGKIDKRALKDPSYARHHRLGWNYRMAPEVAKMGLYKLGAADQLKGVRQVAASRYHEAIDGCDWITPQHVPEGWGCDYWAFAVALESAELWEPFASAVERHGGERPYAAWRITYFENAFKHLGYKGLCPVAEDLQPRLVQGQTNSVAAAERNAAAWSAAIREIGGTR